MKTTSQFHLTEWTLHQDIDDQFFVVLSGYDIDTEESTHFAMSSKELSPLIYAYKDYLIYYGDPNEFNIDLSTHQVLDRLEGTDFHIWKDDTLGIKWFEMMEPDDFFPDEEYNNHLWKNTIVGHCPQCGLVLVGENKIKSYDSFQTEQDEHTYWCPECEEDVIIELQTKSLEDSKCK